MTHATSVAVESEMVKFTYNMPDDVKSVRYEPNTHFVELEDKKGRKTKMPATSILKCVCLGAHCREVFYVQSNMGGLLCPICGSETAKIWGKMQVSFIPEDESEFQTGMTGDLPNFEEETTKDETPAGSSTGGESED